MAGGGGGGGSVFVTVGTTKFDALIAAVDSLAVADELAARGYTSLVIQKGAGAYAPRHILPPGQQRGTLPNGLAVSVFEFAPDLDAHMRAAGCVISHAGSGSLFEALALRRPLIAVPNAALMANHQAELAGHLARLGHCVAATPDGLLEALQAFDAASLAPYQPGDPAGIVAAVDALTGARKAT